MSTSASPLAPRYAKQNVVQLPKQSGGCLSAAYAPEGSWLCVGCFDGHIRVFNTGSSNKQSMDFCSAMTEGRDMKSPVIALKFRPVTPHFTARNVILAVCSDGNITHWHMGSQKELHSLREAGNETYCADYSPDGATFVTGGRDCIVRLYDEERREVIQLLTESAQGPQTLAHSARITAIKYVGPNLVVSGGWDYTIQLWDPRAAKSVRSLYGPYLVGDALDVRGDCLLTGSARSKDQLELWNLAKGERMQVISWPPEGASTDTLEPTLPDVLSAKFNSTGTEIAAGGKNDFRIFDARTGVSTGELKAGENLGTCVYGCAWDPYDSEVAVCCADSTVQIAGKRRLTTF